MKEKFIGHEEPILLVKKAMDEVGLDYKEVAIRGGTDGATFDLEWYLVSKSWYWWTEFPWCS